MPRSGTVHDMFIGEYPWHQTARDVQKDWETSWRKEMPGPVMVSSCDYGWGSGGFDCSIKESIRGSLPSSFLIEKMNLHWSGEEFVFENSEGMAVAWDPSVSERGPSVPLIDIGAVNAFLADNNLRLVWTVLGGKEIRTGGMTPDKSFRQWLDYSGLAVFDEGKAKLIGELITQLRDNEPEKPKT